MWRHNEKCTQISTNMTGICLEMFEILRIVRNKTILCNVGEINGRLHIIILAIFEQFVFLNTNCSNISSIMTVNCIG